MALAKASFEYADGHVQESANRAKNALISLHALGARRLEARAHRVLGLCSLAQEQVQEGADYLANAFDLASLASDPIECILAGTAEAAACFALGDLGGRQSAPRPRHPGRRPHSARTGSRPAPSSKGGPPSRLGTAPRPRIISAR